MRNLTFRGYAQNKGFDPLRVPDQTLKLQQETERTISGMREVRNQNRQNRGEYLQALKEQKSKEADQRQKNFASKRSFDDAYQDAVMQNIKTKILDYGTKAQEHQRKAAEWQKLGDLIPKALNAYGQFDQMRFQEFAKQGSAEFSSYPSWIQEDWRNIREILKSGDKRFNALRDKVGKDTDLWHSLTSMKGYTLYGANHKYVNDWFKNKAPIALNEFKNNKNFVDDQGRTYSQLEGWPGDTTGLGKRAILTQFEKFIKTDIFKPGMYSDEFITDVIQPKIDELIGREKLEISEQVLQNKKRKANETLAAEAQIYMSTGATPAQGVIDFIDNGGNKAENLNTWERTTGAALSTGDIKASQFYSMINEKVVIDGKETSIGQKWPKRVERLQTKLTARGLQLKEKREQEVKALSANLLNEYTGFRHDQGRNMTSTEWDQHIDNILEQHGITSTEREKYFGWIKGEKNREAKPIEDDRDFLEIQSKTVEGIKSHHLLKVDPSLWSEYIPKIKGPGALTEKDRTAFFSLLKNEIKRIGGGITTNPELIDGQNQAIFIKAVDSVTRRLDDTIVRTGLPAREVMDKLIKDEIIKIEKGQGFYERETDGKGNQLIGKQGKWKYAMDSTGWNRTMGYVDKISANPSELNKPGVLHNDDLSALREWVQGLTSNEPPFLDVLANADNTRTKFEVRRDIIMAEYGVKLTPTGPEKTLHYLKEKDRRHLRKNPSKGKTVWLFDVNEENHKALAMMEIKPEFYQHDPDNVYGVVETPEGLSNAVDTFGVTESELTIGSLIEHGNRNMGLSFGAYGLTPYDLKRAVNSGVVSTEDMFTSDLQTALKGEIMYDDSSVFYATESMAQPIPGVGKYFGESTYTGDMDLETTEILLAYLNLDLKKVHPVMYDHLKKLADKYKLSKQQL